MSANQPLFFTGSLVEGIQSSLTQGKLFGCFITDDSEQSRGWEVALRTSVTVSSLIRNNTVFIKLAKDSTEAGYLSAYTPIDGVPSIVFMRKGEVVTKVNAEEIESLGDLITALTEVLESEAPNPTANLAASTQAPTPRPVSTTPSAPAAPRPQPRISSSIPTSSSTSQPKPKLDKGKGRATSPPPQTPPSSTTPRKPRVPKPADEERKRILDLLEADKKARAARKAAERAERLGQTTDLSTHSSDTHPTTHSTSNSQPTQISLLFRLLDGSSHKLTTSHTSTLTSLRPTLDPLVAATAEAGELPPYTFTHLLTPLPSHHFTVSEEDTPLGELGLGRSATIVLKPVKKYVNAGGSGGGLLGGLGGLVGGVSNAVWGVLGYGQVPQRDPDAGREPVRREEERREGGERNRSYYNGNGASFEGRDE